MKKEYICCGTVRLSNNKKGTSFILKSELKIDEVSLLGKELIFTNQKANLGEIVEIENKGERQFIINRTYNYIEENKIFDFIRLQHRTNITKINEINLDKKLKKEKEFIDNMTLKEIFSIVKYDSTKRKLILHYILNKL